MSRAIALAMSCAAAWAIATAADEPAVARGAWIEIYRSWLEAPDGNALPVDPGPAFCLGTDGFVLVDQNAVSGSVHLFATIQGRGPFAARARAFDPVAGLAAVQLHPKVLDGVRCLQLPGDATVPIAAGDELHALGPAGAVPVALRVKKVSPNALSFAGGLQGTFLAGTPLVDSQGILRGVLVAGARGGVIGEEQATGSLAGLASWRHASGAIPVAAAVALIDRVKTQQAEGMPVPPPEPVVRLSPEVFPRSLRLGAGPTREELVLYVATTGETSIEFLTPSSLDALQAIGAYAYLPDRTFFRFKAHSQMWEAMVIVQQSPQFRWNLGPNVIKGSIALERGGERIEAFDSFLDCFEDSVVVESEPGSYDSHTVRACRTFYLFPHEAFAPGADVIVRITEERHGKSAAVPVRPETQARIAADFAPWERAVREAEGATSAWSPSAVVAAVPPLGVPYATRSLGNPEIRITNPAGNTFVVTLVQKGGHPVVRIPVVHTMTGWFAVLVPGFVYAGRDEISFEPLMDDSAKKLALTVPRAEAAVSTSTWLGLIIEARGKTWRFDPAFERTRPPTPGEAFGSGLKESKNSAVELAAMLLGDFDQALRAFETPEILLMPATGDGPP